MNEETHNASDQNGRVPDGARKRRRRPLGRGALFAIVLCTALIAGALGAAGVYLWLRADMNGYVQGAVTEALNSLSLGPQTGNMALYEATDFSGVIERVSEGVVSIVAEGQSQYYGMPSYVSSAGSGIVIRPDGIIVTCAHVVENTDTVTVYLKNGQEYEAEVLGVDQKSDLALLSIQAGNLTSVELGDSSKVHLGENVVAIGNPLGELNGSVTVGVISAIDRSVVIGDYNMTVLQTDAAINPGNSGGALLNAQGQLIGIVNAKSVGVDVEGLGFAIPINRAIEVIDQLLDYGYVKDRPYIGISMQEIVSARLGDEPGVYIVQVHTGTAAEAAGLQIGDRIVSVEENAIETISDIDRLMDTFSVGQSITIVVERDGDTLTFHITLRESSKRSS